MKAPEACPFCRNDQLRHRQVEGLGLIGSCPDCAARYHESAGAITWVSGSIVRVARDAEADVPDCFGTRGL